MAERVWPEGGALQIDRADIVVVGTLRDALCAADGDSISCSGTIIVGQVLVGRASPGDTLEFRWRHWAHERRHGRTVPEQFESLEAMWVLDWLTATQVTAPAGTRVVDVGSALSIVLYLNSWEDHKVEPERRERLRPVREYLRGALAELDERAEAEPRRSN